MSFEQAFVSTVAFVLAAVCLTVALFDVQWFFRMPKAQWAEARWGHRGARLAFGLIGLVLVLLGLYIALGNQGGTFRTEESGSGTGVSQAGSLCYGWEGVSQAGSLCYGCSPNGGVWQQT